MFPRLQMGRGKTKRRSRVKTQLRLQNVTIKEISGATFCTEVALVGSHRPNILRDECEDRVRRTSRRPHPMYTSCTICPGSGNPNSNKQSDKNQPAVIIWFEIVTVGYFMSVGKKADSTISSGEKISGCV